MLVQIRWQGRKMAVPLSQLTAIDPDELTKEAIGASSISASVQHAGLVSSTW